MWIIPQHHKQIDRFYDIIYLLKTATDNKLPDIRKAIIYDLKKSNKYKGREGREVVSSANHNIDELFFYGLVYKLQKKVFISKYGELIFRYWRDFEKRNIIFLFSLFNIQYPNPSKSSVTSETFPFRLLFEVMRNEKIENKIFNPEFYFFYKIEKIENDTVNKIVEKIIEYRECSDKENYFNGDEKDFIKAYVSTSYCFKILEKFGIFEFIGNEGSFLVQSPSRINSGQTTVSQHVFRLNNNFIKIIDKMLIKYPVNEQVRKSELPSELVSEIFNFIAPELWDCLKDENTKKEVDEKFRLPQLIYDYSVNSEKWKEFEEVIADALNLFHDIKAEKVGGAGDTDVVAMFKPYFPDDKNYKIFTADGKSTKNQLMGINSGRLASHRKKYHATFTIVVTPKYAPAVANDIEESNVVILSSLALSELSKNVIKTEKTEFKNIYTMIENNLGLDISNNIYQFIEETFGTNT